MTTIDPRVDLDLFLDALQARRFGLIVWPAADETGWSATIIRGSQGPINDHGDTPQKAALAAWAKWGKAARTGA